MHSAARLRCLSLLGDRWNRLNQVEQTEWALFLSTLLSNFHRTLYLNTWHASRLGSFTALVKACSGNALSTKCPLFFTFSVLFLSLSLSPAASSAQTVRFGVTNVPVARSAFRYDLRHCDLFLTAPRPLFCQCNFPLMETPHGPRSSTTQIKLVMYISAEDRARPGHFYTEMDLALFP